MVLSYFLSFHIPWNKKPLALFIQTIINKISQQFHYINFDLQPIRKIDNDAIKSKFVSI